MAAIGKLDRLADDLHELREELLALAEEPEPTMRAQIPVFEKKIAKLVRELDELSHEQQHRRQTNRRDE